MSEFIRGQMEARLTGLDQGASGSDALRLRRAAKRMVGRAGTGRPSMGSTTGALGDVPHRCGGRGVGTVDRIEPCPFRGAGGDQERAF